MCVWNSDSDSVSESVRVVCVNVCVSVLGAVSRWSNVETENVKIALIVGEAIVTRTLSGLDRNIATVFGEVCRPP